ncbi:hypothetical protein [Metapseudomonas otitidis]|uniref:hypothetical protein n=1 Tax=Metapseudomonas otitidis TaxID=319939 RepID=UPI0013F5EFA2|nr:hypothetical protein [Pseudomonas otitidis]
MTRAPRPCCANVSLAALPIPLFVLRIGHTQAHPDLLAAHCAPKPSWRNAPTMLRSARKARAELETLFDADLIECQAVKSPPRVAPSDDTASLLAARSPERPNGFRTRPM